MTGSETVTLAIVLGSLVLAVLCFFWRRKLVQKLNAQEEPDKKTKRKKLWATILMVAMGWLFATQLLTFLFGPAEGEGLHVEIAASRVELLGFSVSSTVITTWIAMGGILLGALAIRLFLIPRMKDQPRGLQNVLEIAVESVSKYTDEKSGHLGENLAAYIFSVATLMIGCAVIELFGVRAPTADITMTFAMALITFILINYYGIKKKGVGGRIKSLADPTPVVLPLRMISDIAVPVSLACRLFGNMLGGMNVMDLLYSAMGNLAVGVPSLVGLYFNAFHPLIQAYIFVTLTLTFINEAVE